MTESKSVLRNCKKCNRLFSSTDGSVFCSRCNTDIDDEFTRVREYIYDNPTSSVKDVSTGTNVSTEAILKWIKEGKIILSDSSRISFCERCGEPADGNRFCAKCVRELEKGLKSGMEDRQAQRDPSRGGMHIKEGTQKK
ncbi:MAG: hypothetical protein PWQ12_1510 [Clostridiales bacterium]|nr:hypothetical protein [Clostridiales bacterium]